MTIVKEFRIPMPINIKDYRRGALSDRSIPIELKLVGQYVFGIKMLLASAEDPFAHLVELAQSKLLRD